MLVHSVYFWLKPELSEAERNAFQRGLQSLKDIEATHHVYVGTPAAVPARPVLEASYDFALIVLLKDLGAHAEYQSDPIHRAFISDCMPMAAQVRVFDPIEDAE